MKHGEGLGIRARIAALCWAIALALSPVLAQANVLVDRSGTVTAANTSQLAVPASQSRTYLVCQNPVAATGTLFVNIDAAASTTAGSLELAPGGSVTWAAQFVPTGAVNVTSATAGARFICKAG